MIYFAFFRPMRLLQLCTLLLLYYGLLLLLRLLLDRHGLVPAAASDRMVSTRAPARVL